MKVHDSGMISKAQKPREYRYLPVVVEVLAGEKFVDDARRMDVSKEMLAQIPSSKTQVQPTDKSKVVIDDDEFLVVCPVEGHVSHILEDVVIRMAQHVDIAMAGRAFWAESSQSMFCMSRVTGQRLLNFFIHDHINLDTPLGSSFDDLVETPFLTEKGWASQEELGREPPVLDIDGLFGVFQADRDGPEVVTTIDIPFDLVVISLRKIGFEAMTVANSSSLLISGFFMFLVMSMIGIDNVLELAYLVLEMDGFDFGIVKFGVWPELLLGRLGRSKQPD